MVAATVFSVDQNATSSVPSTHFSYSSLNLEATASQRAKLLAVASCRQRHMNLLVAVLHRRWSDRSAHMTDGQGSLEEFRSPLRNDLQSRCKQNALHRPWPLQLRLFQNEWRRCRRYSCGLSIFDLQGAAGCRRHYLIGSRSPAGRCRGRRAHCWPGIGSQPPERVPPANRVRGSRPARNHWHERDESVCCAMGRGELLVHEIFGRG